MKRTLKTHVLSLTLPFGQTLALTLVILIGILGTLEGISRLPPLQSVLHSQRIGNHPELAVKLDLLDQRVRLDGGVDCIFVGSSLVRYGIDPQVISSAYERETGRPIRCFNFGLQSLNAAGSQKLAEILVRKYHPRIVIYGSSFRDFIAGYGFPMDSAWARYELGAPSLTGWLEHYSDAYRYYLAYTTLPDKAILGGEDAQDPRQDFDVYGYTLSSESIDVSRPPDPQKYARQYRISADFGVANSSLAAFQALTQLQETGVKVIGVDMPMASNAIYFLPGEEQDYQDYLTKLSTTAQQDNMIFLHPGASIGIPDSGWADYLHMNVEGAKVFSEWLGKMLAEADQAQTQVSPPQ